MTDQAERAREVYELDKRTAFEKFQFSPASGGVDEQSFGSGYDAGWQSAVRAERERCAKIASEHPGGSIIARKIHEGKS